MRRSFGRTRTSVRWATTLAVTAFARLWLASLRWSVSYQSADHWGLRVGSGLITGKWHDPMTFNIIGDRVAGGTTHTVFKIPTGWSANPQSTQVWWWCHYFESGSSPNRMPFSRFVQIPIWMPTIATGIVAGFAWRGHFRQRAPGTCSMCRYDRTGIPATTPCPECGDSGGTCP